MFFGRLVAVMFRVFSKRTERPMNTASIPAGPRLAYPAYVREHYLKVGRTKWHALVNAGKIRLVDVGAGRKLVDMSSIDDLLAQPSKVAA